MNLKLPYLKPRLNYKFGIKDIYNSILGAFNSKIDTRFCNQLFNCEHVYFLNNARTGLRLVLNSLGLAPNAKIGVQIYNCQTVFNAIKLAGFQPIFIDITKDFRISIEDLKRKKHSIDALIITHTFGIPADIEEIRNIGLDIPIIEDCAHAFLSKYNNQIVGTFGDAGVFSIGKAKFPSIGSGGFVVINNKKIIENFNNEYKNLLQSGFFNEFSNILKSIFLQILHNPFIYSVFTDKILKSTKNKNSYSSIVSYKETKILKSNLYLFNQYKDRINNVLIGQKENLNGLISIVYKNENVNVFFDSKLSLNAFMFPFLSNHSVEIQADLKKKGIELGSHFSKSIEWAKEHTYQLGYCPNYESFQSTIVVFPTYYNSSSVISRKNLEEIFFKYNIEKYDI